MKCDECGRDAIIVRKPNVSYEGINVENVFLRNVEVEFCRPCGNESLVVRNIKKVHLMMALGIALQPAKLSGNELRFLRKAIRISVTEWAERIGIAAETFSRWENGRSPGQQVEKLARIDFLMSISNDLSIDLRLEDSIGEILVADLSEKRDFALVIDAENLDSRPEYRNLRSAEFAKPNSAYIEATTWDTGNLATVRLHGDGKILVVNERLCEGENDDVRYAFAAAA